MRNPLIAALVCLFTSAAAFAERATSPISQLPVGALRGNTYTHDALGVSYQFPAGWTGTADPKGAVTIDWRGPDKVANRCSKVLLWLSPAVKEEGRFNATAIFFALDPACVGLKAFPHSLDPNQVTKVAEKIGKSFNYTAFMSPHGNVVRPFMAQARVMIEATGSLVINAIESSNGRPAERKEPLEVHTSFTFTQTNDSRYLVAWAYAADAPSAEALKSVQITFKESGPH